ncbi:hypothetical protein AHF37_12596 [Paragonimus kellicotti]|nr:hypothetical protein AHF37_12596 [Paragonimus kellicotti]
MRSLPQTQYRLSRDSSLNKRFDVLECSHTLLVFLDLPRPIQLQETSNLISTVLSVQPRVSTGGTGKTNDDVVYELADSILGKLPDRLDLKNAKPEYFQTDSKGRVDSLTTVMTQETDRFNKLLFKVKVSDSIVFGSLECRLKLNQRNLCFQGFKYFGIYIRLQP